MNQEQLRKASEVMAYAAEHPDAVVEYRANEQDIWTALIDPVWDWHAYDYRIRPVPQEIYVAKYSKDGGSFYGAAWEAAEPSARPVGWSPDSCYKVQIIRFREVVE